MRSTLMILVWPTRAHSVRICRSVASFATTDTRPFCMVTLTSAKAVELARSHAAAPMTSGFRVFMVPLQYTPPGPGHPSRVCRRTVEREPFRRAFETAVYGTSLAPEVVDDLGQDVVEIESRLVLDQRLDARQVGHPARHVLEPRLVGLVVRDVLDGGLRAGQLANALGERLDGDLLHVPDVDHLADGLGLLHELDQRADDVGDVREGARLLAVAEHRDRFAGERLTHEVRNHHPVLARLPRSHRVEEAHDDHRELAFLPV